MPFCHGYICYIAMGFAFLPGCFGASLAVVRCVFLGEFYSNRFGLALNRVAYAYRFHTIHRDTQMEDSPL